MAAIAAATPGQHRKRHRHQRQDDSNEWEGKLARQRHVLIEHVEAAGAQPFGVVAELPVAHETGIGGLGGERRQRVERPDRSSRTR
jgi:hypothetical protein